MLSVIKKGSRGEDVSYCQALLNEHGINTSIDGVFGSGTEKSVKQFQSDNGLTADGIVGKSTWASLESKSETSVEESGFKSILQLYDADISIVWCTMSQQSSRSFS